MHSTSTSTPRRFRRRTLAAAAVATVLAGATVIEAVADDTPLHDGPASVQRIDDRAPGGFTSALRMQHYANEAAATQDAQIAFIDTEIRELMAVIAPEGITFERRAIWGRLADCESGDWYDGVPREGTRRWDYGLTFDHGDIFEGGLNFHPKTWDAFRDPDMPSHAGEATAIQQMVVGERVLEAQGWKAWPVCSRKLGYR